MRVIRGPGKWGRDTGAAGPVEATEPPERFEFGFCPPLGWAFSRLTNPPAGSRW